MRTALIVFILFLAALPVWAGTFRDDFEDGNIDGWQQFWPKGEVIWKVVDGELECARQEQWSTEILTGEFTWTDYTVEADVKLLEDYGPGDFDIVVRATTNENGYAFLIGDWVGEPSVYVQLLPDLDMKVVKPFDPLKLDKWHHLKIEAIGDKFTLWINDEKVVEYQDDTYQRGMVGFGLANYTARFDNVVITGPDVPDVMPPTWKEQPVEARNKLTTTWAQRKVLQ
jgi:hypothetical protein